MPFFPSNSRNTLLTNHMNKPFSLTTLVVSYGLALGLFALLCPEGEMAQGLVFQVIVLVLASEAWNFLWWLPSLFLMFRAAKQLEEEKRYGKIAKLTSPILLVVPLLIYLAMMGLNTILPSGSNFAEVCGFADIMALFKASYASVALLFVAALLFPLFPFSFTNFWECLNWDSPIRADRGMVDAPNPPPQPPSCRKQAMTHYRSIIPHSTSKIWRSSNHSCRRRKNLCMPRLLSSSYCGGVPAKDWSTPSSARLPSPPDWAGLPDWRKQQAALCVFFAEFLPFWGC